MKPRNEALQQFVRRPYAEKIAYSRHKNAFRRLPFVGDGCWDVPRTGGYFGGCDTGQALALMYLKHLRQNGFSGGTLQSIVIDMAGATGGSPEEDSFRGQLVGFFAELDKWLNATAKIIGELDGMETRALLKQANDGLNFDTDAYLASQDDG